MWLLGISLRAEASFLRWDMSFEFRDVAPTVVEHSRNASSTAQLLLPPVAADTNESVTAYTAGWWWLGCVDISRPTVQIGMTQHEYFNSTNSTTSLPPGLDHHPGISTNKSMNIAVRFQSAFPWLPQTGPFIGAELYIWDGLTWTNNTRYVYSSQDSGHPQHFTNSMQGDISTQWQEGWGARTVNWTATVLARNRAALAYGLKASQVQQSFLISSSNFSDFWNLTGSSCRLHHCQQAILPTTLHVLSISTYTVQERFPVLSLVATSCARWAAELVAGIDDACVIFSDGSFSCWGQNANGMLGYGVTDPVGDNENPSSMGAVPLDEAVIAIALSRTSVCALNMDLRVRCWGSGGAGQLLRGSDTSGVTAPNTAADSVPAVLQHGNPRVHAISMMRYASCLLTELEVDNIFCVGRNEDRLGFIGANTTDRFVFSDNPRSRLNLGGLRALEIQSSERHSCAVLSNGAVKCWGYGGQGGLGQGNEEHLGGTEAIADIPFIDLGSTSFQVAHVRVSSNSQTTCVIYYGGSFGCFGLIHSRAIISSLRQAGTIGATQTPGSVRDPYIFLDDDAVVDLTVQHNSICAHYVSGSVRCSGPDFRNTAGHSLIDFTGSEKEMPMLAQFSVNEPIERIVPVNGGFCYILVNGAVECSVGSSGPTAMNGLPRRYAAPHELDGTQSIDLELDRCTSVCHLDANNFVAGCTPRSEVARLSFTPSHIPAIARRQQQYAHGVVQFSTSNSHTCALFLDGQVKCWGSRANGMLGRSGLGSAVPIVDTFAANFGTSIASVSAGRDNTCGLTTSGGVRCFGLNTNGECGYPGVSQVGQFRETETAILGDIQTGVQLIAVHGKGQVRCGITVDRDILCFGRGDFGLNTHGRNIGDDEHPASVGVSNMMGTKFTKVTVGTLIAAAITIDGNLLVWGLNRFGRLGGAQREIAGVGGVLGDNESPASIPALALPEKIADVAAYAIHGCVVDVAGAVHCWGLQRGGTLGDPALTRGQTQPLTSSNPVQIGQAAVLIRCHAEISCALLIDGSVSCWGVETVAGLGAGLRVGEDVTPEQAGRINIESAVQLDVGERHACAMGKSGRMFCWGVNSAGAVGIAGTATIGVDAPMTTDSSLLTVRNFMTFPRGSVVAGVSPNFTMIGTGSFVAPFHAVRCFECEKARVFSLPLWLANFTSRLTADEFGSAPFRTGSPCLKAAMPVSRIGPWATSCTWPDFRQASSSDKTFLRFDSVRSVNSSQLSPAGKDALVLTGRWWSLVAFQFESEVEVVVGGRQCKAPRISSSSHELTCITPALTDSLTSLATLAIHHSIPFVENPWVAPQMLQYKAPMLSNVVPSENLPVTGRVVALSGIGFGLPLMNVSGETRGLRWAAQVDVELDGQPGACLAQNHISDTKIECSLAAMYGLHKLKVRVGDQYSAEFSVSFAEPAINFVLPSTLAWTPASNRSYFSVTASGTNLAINSTGLQFKIGDSTCGQAGFGSLTTANFSHVICSNLDASMLPSDVRQLDVQVIRFAQIGTKLSSIRLFGKTRVFSVVPSIVPVTGGKVLIEGLNFGPSMPMSGHSAGLISSVVAGASRTQCSNISVISSTRLSCYLPAGVGSLSPLVINRRAGDFASITSSSLAYAQPVIIRTIPPFLLQHSSPKLSQPILFIGRNFGSATLPTPSSLLNITIDGLPCTSVSFVNSTAVSCGSIPLHLTSGTSRAEVLLSVAGKLADSSQLSLRIVDEPSLRSVEPTIIPVSGAVLSILGAEFGIFPSAGNLSATEMLLNVTVGPDSTQCSDLRVTSETTATCTIPAGVGNLQPLRIFHAGGWLLTLPSSLLEYARPTVASISPSYVLAALSASDVMQLEVTGSSFGTIFTPDQLVNPELTVQVGGSVCPAVRWKSPSVLVCEGLLVSALPDNARLDVQVFAGGLSSGLQGVRLRTFAAPEVSSCLPAIVSAAGGSTLTIVGSGFGQTQSDVTGVMIGAAPCTSIVFVSDTAIRCTSPSLAAAMSSGQQASQLRIAVTLASGTWATSLPGLINFATPAIFFVNPSQLMSAELSRQDVRYNVSVSGLALGDAALANPGSMSICGIQCSDAGGVLLLSSNSRQLVCAGILANRLPPGVAASSPLSVVRVQTNEGLEIATELGAIQVLDAPVITRVQPTIAKAGDSVSLSGRGFGWSATDVAQITIGSVPVPMHSVTWSGSLALSFPVPAPLSSSVKDTAGLPIVLRTSTGLTSAVSTASVFAYERDALPPVTAPAAPCGYRSTTDADIVRAEFSWVDDFISTSFPVTVWAVQFTQVPFFENASPGDIEERLLQNVENTEDVSFLSGASPECSSTAGPAGTVLGMLAPELLQAGNASAGTQARPARQLASLGHNGRINLRLLNTPAQPIWLRIAAVTDGSSLDSTRGPVSAPVGPIFPTCRRQEYLATQHAARGEWAQSVCKLCPEGAVCGGVPWEAITNARGYYRVPWSPDALTFMRCKLDAACPEGASLYTLEQDSPLRGLGFVQDSAWNSTSRLGAFSTANTDQIQMACSLGHESVMCSNCAAGFSGNVDGTCDKCGTLPLVRLALFGGVLTGALVIGFLIRTAIRSRGLPGKAHVALAKLLFVHLQQIALAAAFPMEWPASLQAMFAVFDAGSNVGEALLSIDCLQFDLTSTFLGNTVVQLLVPFAAALAVALVWGIAEGWRQIRWWCAPARPEDPQPVINGYTPQALRNLAPTQDAVVMEAQNPMAALPSSGDTEAQPKPNLPLSTPHSSDSMPQLHRSGADESKRAPPPQRMVMQPQRSGRRKPRRGRLSISSLQEIPSTRLVQWTANRKTPAAAAKPKAFAVARRRVGAALEAKPVVLTPWKCFIVSVFVIMFVFQLNLTRSALTLMTCDEISDRRLLSADLQFDCDDSGNHGWMYGIGVPALVLYGFGVSAVTLVVLYLHRSQLNDPEVRAVLGFLFSSFRDERYYWEVVIQARKVALAFIGVLFRPSGIGVQTTAATTLMVVSSLLHNSALPFRTHVLNHFENASIVVTIITLNGGSTLIDPASSLAMKGFVTVLILCINIAFLVAVLAALARLLCGDLETQVGMRRVLRRIGAKRRAESK